MTKDLTQKVAIATNTLYRAGIPNYELRSELAYTTIKNSLNNGYEVVIVDGGSEERILKKIRDCGAKIFPQKLNGMGQGKRQAIEEALNTGREIIAWTEPEKVEYISELYRTVTPILKGKAEIVIPCRNSLESYSTIQKDSEKLASSIFEKFTGKLLDIHFGPKTWSKDCSIYFLDSKFVKSRYDYLVLPVAQAILEGRRVIGVDIEYIHPSNQTESEENNLPFSVKRIEQLTSMTRDLESWKKGI